MLPLVFMSILWLGQQPTPARTPEARPARDRYALLVGVGEYSSVREWKLDGPPNDARLWRDLLVGRFKFPDDDRHVRVLSDTAGAANPGRLPTRENIRLEFERLKKALGPGDSLFILLAGHGSQQPADFSRPGNYEPDGLDEVFLPRDAGRYAGDRIPNAIVDDDLRQWVDDIVATRAMVWIVMDCCHSGTGLRGERPRRPTEWTMPDVAREAAAREGRRRYGADAADTAGASFVPESPNVAAIFACTPNDTTPEMIMKGDQWNGLLSFTCIEALGREPAGSTLSTLELVDRVRGLYLNRDRDRPTPLPEGKLVNKVFLTDEEKIPPLPPIHLTQDGSQWRLDAGLLRGIHEGTTLKVFAPDSDPATATSVAQMRVVEVRVAESFAERQREASGAGGGGEKPIKDGSICVIDVRSAPDFRLPVAVDPQTRSTEMAGSPLVPLPEDDRRRLAEQLATIAGEPRSPIRTATPYERGAWLLQRPALGSKALELAGPARDRKVRIAEGPDLPVDLRKKAGAIAKALNLVEIRRIWEDERQRLGDAQDIKVGLRLVRVQDGREAPIPVSSTSISAGLPIVSNGDLLRIYVRNEGQVDVDVNLLFISSRYGVTSEFPEASRGYNTLSPRDEPLRIGFRVIATEEGVERWMLIAVRSAGLSTTDFVFLQQDGLKPEESGDIINRAKTRGAEGPSLEELLMAAGFPSERGGQRGDFRPLDSSNCIVNLIEYRITPKAKADGSRPR